LHALQIRQHLSPVLQRNTGVRFKEESFLQRIYSPHAERQPTKLEAAQGSILQTQGSWGLWTLLQQNFHSHQQPWCHNKFFEIASSEKRIESVPAANPAANKELQRANAELYSWHTCQDPPNPRLPGQAVLTPIVMTRLECIEKVLFQTIKRQIYGGFLFPKLLLFSTWKNSKKNLIEQYKMFCWAIFSTALYKYMYINKLCHFF